ncbi:hypothetical protein BGZ70_010501 [Mortierella alpina]|uniref:Uncharacterized protein n=1 Tax=Mortierella alpina TaxID=64518 RepID=A0A9P6IZ56_MORAP|nr:hypothetical protein BGZ70_010501 [Mortierella alpina]
MECGMDLSSSSEHVGRMDAGSSSSSCKHIDALNPDLITHLASPTSTLLEAMDRDFAAAVCMFFSNPCFWTDIFIMDKAGEVFITSEDAAGALRTHRHHIQSFTTGSHHALSALIAALLPIPSNAPDGPLILMRTELRRIRFRWWGYDEHPSNVDSLLFGNPYALQWDTAVLSILSSSPLLTSVEVDLTLLHHPLLGASISSLQHLQTLSISGYNKTSTYSKTVALLLDALPGQVSDLTLDMSICPGDDKLPVCPYIPCKNSPVAIKRLGLHASILFTPEPVVSRLMDRLQGLRSIALLGGLSHTDPAHISSMLKKSCPLLDELEIKCDEPDLQDQQIASLIWVDTTTTNTTTTTGARVTRASSAASLYVSKDTEQEQEQQQQQDASRSFSWRSIKIDAPNFESVSSAAIVKHAATLEKVILPSRGLDASDLLALFLRAPRLQELVSLHEHANKRRDYYFRPAMARGKAVPWVCSESLRVLKISVQPGKTAASTRDTFLNRLGGFYNLRVLHLRNGVRGVQGFTDFTLANGGLERLETLTQLEAFEIKDFAHKMGQEEQDWMKSHWPHLTSICLNCDGHEHGCEI